MAEGDADGSAQVPGGRVGHHHRHHPGVQLDHRSHAVPLVVTQVLQGLIGRGREVGVAQQGSVGEAWMMGEEKRPQQGEVSNEEEEEEQDSEEGKVEVKEKEGVEEQEEEEGKVVVRKEEKRKRRRSQRRRRREREGEDTRRRREVRRWEEEGEPTRVGFIPSCRRPISVQAGLLHGQVKRPGGRSFSSLYRDLCVYWRQDRRRNSVSCSPTAPAGR